MAEISLTEIKRRNILAGGHFFDKGNPRVIFKQGKYLVTESVSGDGWVVYKFEDNGRISFVDNPSGEYSWQPYKNKSNAILYAKKLNKIG